jgi:hypothetical protein
MRDAWWSQAVRTEFKKFPTGAFRDVEHRKAVWHTTQGGDGVLSWYPQSGNIPHFTIMTNGEIHQHYSCNRWSRALRNLRGGVETNTDGAIQVELVGFAGEDLTAEQLVTVERLAAWMTKQDHVAPVFPMGRLSKPYTRATPKQWDDGVGHFAHGMVPEQDHSDPDMTDSTWAALQAGVLGGTWLMPPLTEVQVQQKMLWDAGFAQPPHTHHSYARRSEWMDGDAGPETRRAQAAFDAASQAVTQTKRTDAAKLAAIAGILDS